MSGDDLQWVTDAMAIAAQGDADALSMLASASCEAMRRALRQPGGTDSTGVMAIEYDVGAEIFARLGAVCGRPDNIKMLISVLLARSANFEAIGNQLRADEYQQEAINLMSGLADRGDGQVLQDLANLRAAGMPEKFLADLEGRAFSSATDSPSSTIH